MKIRSNKNCILWEYILNMFPDKTKSFIKREINKGNVRVNNKKVKDNCEIKINDEILIYFRAKKMNKKFLECNINCEIFYQDDNIIIFNKKKGILCQEDGNEKINTLNNFVKKYCYENRIWDLSPENEPSLIHRLDKNTSGLIIAGKNKEIVKILNKEMNNHAIIKKYITIVHGFPNKNKDVLVGYIKQVSDNKMKVFNKHVENSKEIRTIYNLLYSYKNLSLLEVTIESGKKHQIRAHLSHNNLHIVGDYKYANKKYKCNIKSQILISNEIKFNLSNKKLEYLNKKTFILNELNNDDDKKIFIDKQKICQ